MKRSLVLVAASMVSLLALTDVAAAQSNPFVPQNQGGLTRRQVEEIVRQQQAEQAAQPSAQQPATPGAPGSPQTATDGIPAQPNGTPGGSPVAGAGVPGAAGVTAVVAAEDPVAALISEGGSFVGCVRNVPIFRDSVGRRIYFTTSELKASDAIKRYARC